MLTIYDSSFPRSILARMPLTSHEEIGRVGRRCYEDAIYDLSLTSRARRASARMLARMSRACYVENGPVKFKLDGSPDPCCSRWHGLAIETPVYHADFQTPSQNPYDPMHTLSRRHQPLCILYRTSWRYTNAVLLLLFGHVNRSSSSSYAALFPATLAPSYR